MMDPEKMGSIFQNINKIMEQKMENGDLNEDILKEEAQNMYGNMSNNPLFGNLMGQMNQAQPPDNSDGTSKDKRKDKISTGEKKDKLPCEEMKGKYIQKDGKDKTSTDENKKKLKKKIDEKKKERSK